MIPTFDNFGINTVCPLCLTERDQIEHVLDCLILKLKCPDVLLHSNIKISDARDENIEKMNELSQVFEKAWRKREELLLSKGPSN